MKRIIIFTLLVLVTLVFVSCGSTVDDPSADDTGDVKVTQSVELEGTYIITVSEISGCTLTSTYIFDDDMKLESVSQNAKYTDSALMSIEYAIVEENSHHYTDIVKEDSSFSCKLTREAMDQFYPDATYDSILATANEQGLSVETSK
ncbi:MAG: hypothetical protein IJC50_03145 [Clostridia bacterium]|nr:hypothetical protein [Clostridia bacterium]